MVNKNYDYIIVGAGSAGCVLASRLSEDANVSVCLIESGKKDDSALVQCPTGFALTVPHGFHSWHYETVPQPQLNNRRGFVPRGKVLGGSSSINAMVYIRGNAWDFDNWAAQGNAGWNYESLLPYFIKAENNHTLGDSALHGDKGPLHVNELIQPSPLSQTFITACTQQGLQLNSDINGVNQEGCRFAQVTQNNGERCSAAKAYITPVLDRPNLTVLTNTQANRLIINDNHVDGVEVMHEKRLLTLHADKEVIVSTGAINSPQLLMLSGIGDKDSLKQHNIDVKVDLPGVGQNLQDHITVVPLYRTHSSGARANDSLGISLKGAYNILSGAYQWMKHRDGLLTTNAAESHAFIKLEDSSPAPDIQLEFVIGLVDDHSRKLHWGHGYSVHSSLMRPKSRGDITLADNKSTTPPVINPNFLDHPDDLATLLAGFKKALSILEDSAFDDVKGNMIYPLDRHNDQQLIDYIRETADTEYHPVGTCKMGPSDDSMSVVDDQLRVRGLNNLRVVDASIMPTIITGNTNATVIAIAEKAADLIKNTLNK